MINFPIPEFRWLTLLPLIVMAVTGMAGLVTMMFAKGNAHRLVAKVSMVGVVLAMCAQFAIAGADYLEFDSLLFMDRTASVNSIVIQLGTLLCLAFLPAQFEKRGLKVAEAYPLMVWAALGGMVMCSTRNMLVLFVGLELLSISLYVLAGLDKRSKESQEAALKYFLLGAFATGFFLYGAAMLYGVTGSLDIQTFMAFWRRTAGGERLLITFSFLFILVGLAFKAGLAPFHQWIPDVYKGAPLGIVAFMATVGKVGPFMALFWFATQLMTFGGLSFWIFAILSVLSMVIGNVMAFRSTDLKGLMAYSSIANAGYLCANLAALLSGRTLQYWPHTYFVIGYVFTTLGAFAVISVHEANTNGDTSLSSLKGLAVRSPLLVGMFTLFALSQIGIGPVAGFIGKMFFVTDLVRFQQLWLAAILLATTAYGAYYYFKIIQSTFSSEGAEAAEAVIEVPIATKLVMTVCAVIIVGMVVLYPMFERLLRV
ncbi:MAG TPA: NADH-quinone oxidoreductase subunit N [Fimbriimonas sp.]|nr:NADH-quinone oxidoreductase subunit N [Fimbriimonas sp.]